jgi:hypothetical protein
MREREIGLPDLREVWKVGVRIQEQEIAEISEIR